MSWAFATVILGSLTLIGWTAWLNTRPTTADIRKLAQLVNDLGDISRSLNRTTTTLRTRTTDTPEQQ